MCCQCSYIACCVLFSTSSASHRQRKDIQRLSTSFVFPPLLSSLSFRNIAKKLIFQQQVTIVLYLFGYNMLSPSRPTFVWRFPVSMASKTANVPEYYKNSREKKIREYCDLNPTKYYTYYLSDVRFVSISSIVRRIKIVHFNTYPVHFW